MIRRITTSALAMLATISFCFAMASEPDRKPGVKTVYMSYILHGNMNYDRYVRPVIWKEFPVIYDNFLDFMDEHPEFRGQLQFSGQTVNSLKICAPEVLEHAKRIHARGQLNFTGTFYSEPVNVNMDGETNFRCALLGTRIVEDETGGKTDGFYLQERAYHPQLPWILKNAGVSWVPVITGDESYKPFVLKGLDGTESVCVPVTRSNVLEKVKNAPDRSLIVVEEDYEIPQTFTSFYNQVQQFTKENPGIKVEWITVKDYIGRHGLGPAQYVDHTAKSSSMEGGTYSRWTADPLDIIVQKYTSDAMSEIRKAWIINYLVRDAYGFNADCEASSAGISAVSDPLAWDIARPELYPWVETGYLTHDGKVTLLSKAEHDLLWAVNSDSKGWFPLYEKRRERLNSLENSIRFSKEVEGKALRWIGENVSLEGYDKYFIAFNSEPSRTATFSKETDFPCTLFDYSTGESLDTYCIANGDGYTVSTRVKMPSYGFKIIAARATGKADMPVWKDGDVISSDGITLHATDSTVTLDAGTEHVVISLEPFMLKALAQMSTGKGDDQLRPAAKHGASRITVCSFPEPALKVESQPDWLVHLSQTFTIRMGTVICEASFTFPHPTIVRHNEMTSGRDFDPRGLNLRFRTNRSGDLFYDLPFGISRYDKPDPGWFCPLSSMFIQHQDGGFTVAPQTGEQAFSADPSTGDITLYLGASTTTGPIKKAGLRFKSRNDVDHDEEWMTEVFHGTYNHTIALIPFSGSWISANVPESIRQARESLSIRECPVGKKTSGLPAAASLLQIDNPHAEVTSADFKGGKLSVRLNEKVGTTTKTVISTSSTETDVTLPAFGIVDVNL